VSNLREPALDADRPARLVDHSERLVKPDRDRGPLRSTPSAF